MTAVAEKVGEWMAGIVVVMAERETVVRVTVNVHTKSVHARVLKHFMLHHWKLISKAL